ncbi:hypothetical protein B0H66DRAFT_604903 [Apodospora peruviana]|uniref:N-acetyltransferase domain-containing protein n=1 Tax=Apodospora peruviana TaxID=516989 RepID=A0AAE0M2R3_9PEZI|nr:hypothetical protein B0H66DRAFT_604903 [Apodospora peruviana]
MNRFRTKRRAKDDSATGRSSEDSEHTSSKPSFKSFRRGKKAQNEEPKVEFNLSTALPSNDDFRTSLLMTNLSARFSMLREQDDPNTKIGKASDDSVLYPKRQSRMADFGFGVGGGLSDIAEVESIRAPFMRTGIDSYASDDADSTKIGSVMNRSKPTEGNNLFGGRQKIYKIPAGSSSKPSGGLPGRALYDDDVALSAFQRWRQAEKDRTFGEEDRDDSAAEGDTEQEQTRTESPPPVGYNRKRETSSTTSSASLRARNSTAATSITSQPTPSVKDWQSVSSVSAASTPALERNVTRTRRLYEQVSTQDTHDQPALLSRTDTFARQRPFGNRTPDLGGNSPSPTSNVFTDRLTTDKRSILTKVSAPNLRSMSPPVSGSSMGAMDLGISVPSQADPKINFGGSPPLSPPISETGENPLLPIQPSDVGKATALGVFHKPSQPYDESIYAQRQIQLQQGRDTPNGRVRTESNASLATGRSRSSSSANRQPFESKLEPIKTQPPVQEEGHPRTFLDMDSPEPDMDKTVPSAVLHVRVQRPADNDHPALRQSALPTPLSLGVGPSSEPSPISATPSILVDKSEQATPEHSPTLGSTTGLSGMVRQHLRSESNSSSVYGVAPPTTSLDPRFPVDPFEPPQIPEGLGAKSNPWITPEQEWTLSYYSDKGEPSSEKRDGVAKSRRDSASDSKPSDRSSNDMESETDEFASQLADARRRVRERLTSYVESDSSRAASPSPRLEPTKDVLPPIPSNPLNILKPKSSRGSLIDRSRGIVGGQSKAMKMLGLSASTMSSSQSPNKPLSDEKDGTHLETMEEVPKEEELPERPTSGNVEKESEPAPVSDKEDDGNTHPGLKAFRQARRELQRRKELELLARHQLTQTTQPQDQPVDQAPGFQSPPRAERGQGLRQRTPSKERKPPPILYRQRAPSDERSYGMNNSPSAQMSSAERERSGSESNGGRSASNSRPPPRPRNNMGPHEPQLAPVNTSRPPMLRSPGLPGTDIRRSPIMPPQGYPSRSVPSPMPSSHTLDKSRSTGHLAIQPGRPGCESNSGQPSPISPLGGIGGLPPSPFAGSPATTPTTTGPRPRNPSAAQSPGFSTTTSTLNESMKRVIDKRDISEPTFVMSTSRVPTVNLPHPHTAPDVGSGSQSRSGSRSRSSSRGGTGPPPPVPPINPRRRRDNSARRGYEDSELGAPNLPFANQTNSMASDYSDDNRSAFSVSDDEESKGGHRQRLRKTNMEGFGGRVLGKMRDNSPPFMAKGPPASRTVATTGPKCRATLPPTLSSSAAGYRMAPYLWTLQFTHLFPSNCFVLDDGSGKAVGYVIGVPDVFAFARLYPRYISEVLQSPQGLADVPPPKQLDKLESFLTADPEGKQIVNTECMAQNAYSIDWLVLDGVEGKRQLVETYRAMLHIDLIEGYQGQGWGRHMIERFVESIKAMRGTAVTGIDGEEMKIDYGKGIQLGVSGENTKVVKFYEKLGFRVYPGGEKEGNVWMVRDL